MFFFGPFHTETVTIVAAYYVRFNGPLSSGSKNKRRRMQCNHEPCEKNWTAKPRCIGSHSTCHVDSYIFVVVTVDQLSVLCNVFFFTFCFIVRRIVIDNQIAARVRSQSKSQPEVIKSASSRPPSKFGDIPIYDFYTHHQRIRSSSAKPNYTYIIIIIFDRMIQQGDYCILSRTIDEDFEYIWLSIPLYKRW